MEFTGSLVHEYVVCKRAAWYSYRGVRLENEYIILGKMLHEKSYKGEIKNLFGEGISIDFTRKENGEVWIYEVKRSSKMLNAARMQLLFYLKWLKDRGVEVKGKIAVPEEKYTEMVELNEENEKKIEDLLKEMEVEIGKERPPKPVWQKICEKCSYLELCWA